MSKHKDKIPGGLADKKKPKDFDSKKLKAGAKVELEHTSDKAIAQEIAMDHLEEDKEYYKKLKSIEKADKKSKPGLIERMREENKASQGLKAEQLKERKKAPNVHQDFITGKVTPLPVIEPEPSDKLKQHEMIEVTPDGKQEPVPGKEPLKKDPKKAKLKDRWSLLKAALDNAKAIIDLKEEAGLDEEEAKQQQEEEQQAMQQQQPQEQEGSDQQPQEEQPQEEQPQEEQPQEEQPPQVDGDQSQESPDGIPTDDPSAQPEATDDEIKEALRDEGHSEAEIAYIVHGHHSMPADQTAQAKAYATMAMSDVDVDSKRQMADHELESKRKHAELEHAHANRMKDLEYQHAQMQSPDPETERNHKKRMLDLEYENAKNQSVNPNSDQQKQIADIELQERHLELEQKRELMRLELEFKKREQELKLKMVEENMKMQAKNKAEHTKLQHTQKMKETQNPDKKKLKKGEDDEQD